MAQAGNISLPEETLTEVIRSYTREAGVRSLEREIGALCRKTAIKLVEEDNLDQCVTITPEDLETYLGVKKYRMDENEKSPQGRAWSTVWPIRGVGRRAAQCGNGDHAR